MAKKPAQEKIDKKRFEELCECQCTEEAIALYFGVDGDTVNNWCKNTYGKTFSEVFKEKRQKGLDCLRSRMYENAMTGGKYGKGENVLQIFLAKNWLGMSDKVESQVTERIEIVGEIDED